MIEWLRSEGVPIDGVGLQAHYDVVSFDVDQFEDTVRTLTDMGLDVQVTEADVSIYPWTYNGEVYETLPDDIALGGQRRARRYHGKRSGEGIRVHHLSHRAERNDYDAYDRNAR